MSSKQKVLRVHGQTLTLRHSRPNPGSELGLRKLRPKRGIRIPQQMSNPPSILIVVID